MSPHKRRSDGRRKLGDALGGETLLEKVCWPMLTGIPSWRGPSFYKDARSNVTNSPSLSGIKSHRCCILPICTPWHDENNRLQYQSSLVISNTRSSGTYVAAHNL